MSRWLTLAIFLSIQSCGKPDENSQNTPNNSHTNLQSAAGDGYVDIMPKERMDMWRPLLPKLADTTLNDLLHGKTTLWYDKSSIVPGYQDSMGDPVGMRPNSIAAVMIDTAVPGGHARLFAQKGRFNFPFGTGGVDNATDVTSINFWVPPRDAKGKVIPVGYWSSGFTRLRWVFPVGTVLGEVLFMKFPNGSYRVFEVRFRTRMIDDWDIDVLRPFATAMSLAEAVKTARPQWSDKAKLATLIKHLESNEKLTAKTLETRSFPGSFERLQGYVDVLPDFEDHELAETLLKNTTFSSVKKSVWKQNGTNIAYGATAETAGSIVPRKYDGALFQPTKEFCNRCHTDAGRGIGDWHNDLVAYGEIWGEDRSFSWHPFQTSPFVDKNGDVQNFNYDNRRMRDDFKNAGLVIPQKPNKNSDTYRELYRSWEWHPF